MRTRSIVTAIRVLLIILFLQHTGLLLWRTLVEGEPLIQHANRLLMIFLLGLSAYLLGRSWQAGPAKQMGEWLLLASGAWFIGRTLWSLLQGNPPVEKQDGVVNLRFLGLVIGLMIWLGWWLSKRVGVSDAYVED